MKNINEIGEKYRKQSEQLEKMKHIGEIRKKIDFIEGYRAHRAAMMEKKKEMDVEREKMYKVDREMVME